MIDLVASEQQQAFGLAKRDTLPQYCRDCDVRFACHGGCPKDRFLRTPDGEPGLNYLCPGFKVFFHHIGEPMGTMAALLRGGPRAVGDHGPVCGGRRPARSQRSVHVRQRQEVEALPRRTAGGMICGPGADRHCRGSAGRPGNAALAIPGRAVEVPDYKPVSATMRPLATASRSAA